MTEHRLGILLRWLDQVDLDALFLPVRPTPASHLFDHLKAKIPKLTRRRFALTLGCDEGQASKWLLGKEHPHPLSAQLITLVSHTPSRSMIANWQELERLSLMEAQLRGIPDLFAAASWCAERPPRDRLPQQRAA